MGPVSKSCQKRLKSATARFYGWRKVRSEMAGRARSCDRRTGFALALDSLRAWTSRFSWPTVSRQLARAFSRFLLSSVLFHPHMRANTRVLGLFAAAAGCGAAGWDGRSWRARVQVPARSKLCRSAHPPECGVACCQSTYVVLAGISARSGQFFRKVPLTVTLY